MDILQNIFGQGNQAAQRVEQYQQAAQAQQVDHLDDKHVDQDYQKITQSAPPDVLSQAYAQAFNNLPPAEQQKILNSLQHASNDPNQPFQFPSSPSFPSGNAGATQQTPAAPTQQTQVPMPQQHQVPAPQSQQSMPDISAVTKQAQEQQPDLLQNVFGPDGPLSTPMAKVAMVGVAAAVAGALMGRPGSGGGALGEQGNLRDKMGEILNQKMPGQ